MHQLEVPNSKVYMISQEHQMLLDSVATLNARGENCNVLVGGKSGCGKSEMATQFAAKHGRPLATLEVGQLSESRQIFGYTDLKDGQTAYIPGLFAEAIQTPNAVIHLQELNRPETDKALNAIFSILDDSFRYVYLDEVGYIKVAPGVTFFGTLNEGYEFIGTMPLDDALRNRFEYQLQVGYLPVEVERSILLMRGVTDIAAINKLLSVANTLRHNAEEPMHISTRDTINITRLMSTGVNLFYALKAVVGSDPDKLESIFLSRQLAGDDNRADFEDMSGYVPF
jgi:nitric oxide reductase NorQ protein